MFRANKGDSGFFLKIPLRLNKKGEQKRLYGCREMENNGTMGQESPDWEAWLDEHGPRLLLYARQRTRSIADAEDVLQSSLIELVRIVRTQEFRKTPAEWHSYALSCIRNKAIDLMRSQSRQQSTAQAAAHEQGAVYDQIPLLGSRQDNQYRREQLERVLHHMRADYAEVVILHVWEGLTFREIATMLNEPPATIASRYRAALRIFRQQLEEDTEIYPES